MTFELDRVISGANPYHEAVLVKPLFGRCQGDATDVLRKVKRCYTALWHISNLYPYQDKHSPERNNAYLRLYQWLDIQVSTDLNYLDDLSKIDSFAQHRDWLWWDATVHSKNEFVVYLFLTDQNCKDYDSLRWLMCICGATLVETNSQVLSTRLVSRWKRIKAITGIFFKRRVKSDYEHASSLTEAEHRALELHTLEDMAVSLAIKNQKNRQEIIEAFPQANTEELEEKLPTEWKALLMAIDDIDKRLYELSNERRGGGWTTSSCVVGKDMHRGLLIAMKQVRMFQVDANLSVQQNKDHLVTAINEAAMRHTGHDSEGYVVGTMRTVAIKIDEIELD